MPRPKREPVEKPNSLVASAAQITSRRRVGVPKESGTGGWQAEAWTMLDMVGELEFYREWVANALSRVTLWVSEVNAAGETVKTAEPLPLAALAALYDGDAGQPQMLGSLGGHIAIPGESWLVGLVEPPKTADGPDTWRVLSRDEVKSEGSTWVIDRGDGEVERYEDGSREGVPAQALVIRLWSPHPRKWAEATSSVRSALPILRELVGLSKKVAADIDSRLAGAGVLFVPSEMTFTSPLPGQAAEDPAGDPFVTALTDAMVAAMSDRGSPASVAPIVVKAPAQYLDKIKHITFWSEFSAEARELRGEAITRLASSLNVPAEVLTGLGDSNHWSAWLLDESAIKMHIEPLVGIITHGLTTRYLWPILQGNAPTLDPTMRRFKIEGDTSALRQRPNRSAEAQALHADMVITNEALARETGFDTNDLLNPASEEYRQRMLQKTAQGVTTADVTVAALAQLGIPLVPKASEVDAATPTATGPQAVGPAPEPPAVEQRQPPAQDAAAAIAQARTAALVLGAEGIVTRALEKAWNKAGKRRGGVRQPVPADQLDSALHGAWDRVPRVAAMTGVDPDRLLDTLNTYTRTLLATGAEHAPTEFAQVLVDRVIGVPLVAIGG